MAKIAVKLTHPANSFKDDDGVKFEAYEVRLVEDSERIQQALSHRMLTRVREAEEQAQEESKPVSVSRRSTRNENKEQALPANE